LGQYTEYPKNSSVLPGSKTIGTDDHLAQLAKANGALDERIRGTFLIPPVLDEVLRSSTRVCHSDKLINVWCARLAKWHVGRLMVEALSFDATASSRSAVTVAWTTELRIN
jgi:hypothetical protein